MGGAHKPAAILRLRSQTDGFLGQGCGPYENKILWCMESGAESSMGAQTWKKFPTSRGP